MKNEIHITPDTRQVLLVAASNDPQVNELITALQVSGMNVLAADTITLAAQADKFAICIIILRPGQWRTTATITTAMRCNPRYMIPVLAEPISLPAAPWSTEAIIIKEPLSETVHELEILINKQLQIASKDTHKDQKEQEKNDFSVQKAPSAFSTINANKARRNLSSMSKYALIGLILVLLAGLLVYYTSGKHAASVPNISTQLGGGITPVTSAFQQSDIVSVPGLGCNTNNSDWWGTGTHYKTLATPTVTATNTTSSPQAMPTSYVIHDNTIVATCQKNGLYVQHTSHYDGFAEVFFQGNAQEALPQHFSTQITSTALNPSDQATFSLGVHHQISDALNSENSGYGDDLVEVRVDGSWRTIRTNDVTDQEDITFTKGYIKPSHTMTLGAEVDGPRITFSINGQKVTTIVDTTFPFGYAIGFGLSDSGAKSPTKALYSNFSYLPLANTTLPTQAVVATATAQASNNLHAAYRAARPGPGCDQGPEQWQPVTKENNYATASCQPHGLALSQDATAKYVGYSSFYGLDGNLPTNYKVKVQVDTSQLHHGCAGVGTRIGTGPQKVPGYNFSVCDSGYWNIARYNRTGGAAYLLAEGYVTPQTVYTIVATSNRDVQSLSVDGVTVSTLHDASLQITDHIVLTIYVEPGTAGTALYSNFVFTPLP